MGENKNLLKTNRPHIMNHINRLNNYVTSEIANITVRSELNEEALVIFEKAELLVDYVSSIEPATESAERIDEDEVCVMLGKLQQLVNEAMQCPSSRPAPRCDQGARRLRLVHRARDRTRLALRRG